MATIKRTCSITECGKPVRSRGYCNKHYENFRVHGEPVRLKLRQGPECAIPRCGKKPLARGWCAKHYTRWRKTGSLDLPTLYPADLCSVDGCITGSTIKGYCQQHYARSLRNGGDAGGLTFAKASPIIDGTKKCFTCEEVKPLSDFNKHPRNAGGVGSNCRLCLSAKSREWFAKNPEYRAEWNARNTERKLADVHRRRAVRMDVDADLIDRRVVFERDGNVCQLCGDPMDMSQKTPRPLAPTIDHVIPISRGGTHTMDNIQSAHFHCNISKGNRDAPLTRPLAA